MEEMKMTRSGDRESVATLQELGALWRALLRVAPGYSEPLNARVVAVVLAVAQNVGVAREFQRVSVADLTRLISRSGPTGRRALDAAEQGALIYREQRRTPGGQPYGVVRLGAELLAEYDEILEAEES